jgi:hypothetical protein
VYLIKTEDGFLQHPWIDKCFLAFSHIDDAENTAAHLGGTVFHGLRNLIAHVDPEDPIRGPSRRGPGFTRSPYSSDFEIDDEALEADLKEVRSLCQQ